MIDLVDIRALRKARKMTQEQVGILAGMSKSQVSRMENGTLGSTDTYQRVLSALGYKIVVRLEDTRSGNTLDADKILSMLKVYYLCNFEKLGIDNIGLFGSFARGEAGADSDIDIIISLKKPNLFLYSQIADNLETVFGRRVDLVSAKAHHTEKFKEQLEKEAIYVSK
ncbi:MAG: nucleotidyltransferase domain-containing protein [Bacteroidales bacterium]|nr:nucleotidyltransferase domain-containing protein [Bacteroidales bacterium]